MQIADADEPGIGNERPAEERAVPPLVILRRDIRGLLSFIGSRAFIASTCVRPQDCDIDRRLHARGDLIEAGESE